MTTDPHSYVAVQGTTQCGSGDNPTQTRDAFLRRKTVQFYSGVDNPAVRSYPAFLKHLFLITGSDTVAFGLLPFGKIEVSWITFFAVHQTVWQAPFLSKKDLTRDVSQLEFEMRMVAGGHSLDINVRPNGVSMASSIFLVKDNYERLT